MQTRLCDSWAVGLVLPAAVLWLLPTWCDANVKCVDGASVRVCVLWSQPQPPVEDVDFRVSFADELNPDVELITGDAGGPGLPGWWVWSKDPNTGDPRNLGNVTIDPSQPSDNFAVTIPRVVGKAAVNVKSVNLTSSGWTGWSTLSGGVSGSFTGDLIIQKSGGGAGGTCNFVIDQGMTGDVIAPVVDVLDIGWMGGVYSGAMKVGEIA